MFLIDFDNLVLFVCIPGCYQSAVIGKQCAIKTGSIDIVRTYFQAQSTFQTFCNGILMCLILFSGWLIITDINS